MTEDNPWEIKCFLLCANLQIITIRLISSSCHLHITKPPEYLKESVLSCDMRHQVPQKHICVSWGATLSKCDQEDQDSYLIPATSSIGQAILNGCPPQKERRGRETGWCQAAPESTMVTKTYTFASLQIPVGRRACELSEQGSNVFSWGVLCSYPL